MAKNSFMQKVKESYFEVLTINSEGIIQVVEHDIPSYFNDENKKIILFLSSLVGKKLQYKAQEDGVIDPLEPVLDYLYDEA